MSDTTAASLPGLGSLVKDYRLSPARIRQIVVVMLVAGVVAACFFLTAIFTNDLTPNGIRERIGITLPGLLFTLPVIFGVRQLIRVGGSSLSLYQDGLVYRRLGKEARTTWDEVDAVIEDSACRITKKDGEVIEFGASIEGLDEVMDEVQAQTLRKMLPEAQAAIRAGATVEFKGLKPFGGKQPGKGLNQFAYASSGYAVDARGITALESGQRIAWENASDYGIEQAKMGRIVVDVFFIESGEARFQTRLGLLSNAHVLLALCQELVPGQTAENDSNPKAS